MGLYIYIYILLYGIWRDNGTENGSDYFGFKGLGCRRLGFSWLPFWNSQLHWSLFQGNLEGDEHVEAAPEPILLALLLIILPLLFLILLLILILLLL